MAAPSDPPSIESSPPVADMALLALLLEAAGPLGVDALARRRGISHGQVQMELERLQAAGCELHWHPAEGVRLVRTGLGVWVDYLRHAAGRADRPVEVYAATASTQDAARRLAQRLGPAAEGAVVAADCQTAGRGRLGRRWLAPPGTALTFSRVALGRDQPPEVFTELATFATAVAVAQAIETLARPPLMVQIKWPNDLFVGGAKLGGILVETFAHPAGTLAIIGIGLNVALRPDDLALLLPGRAAPVTSLAAHGQLLDRLPLLAAITRALDHALAARDLEPLLEEWRRRSTLIGQYIRVHSDGRPCQGQVLDLDPRAGLILRTDAGAILHLRAQTSTIV